MQRNEYCVHKDNEEGTVVACFGAVRELQEGEEGTARHTHPIRVQLHCEGNAITPIQGVTEGWVTHAINHTGHPGFVNCRFVHAGIVGAGPRTSKGV
jgi:hypothetical protein